MGLKVKQGVVQDATFITSDPGHAKADTPRGNEAKTRRSKDGTWAKKGSKSFFGYKLHSKPDMDYGLIRDLETTTASVHDSQVDLSSEGEVVYRDKGYHGTTPKGYSATTKRRARDHPLSIMDNFIYVRSKSRVLYRVVVAIDKNRKIKMLFRKGLWGSPDLNWGPWLPKPRG
jgi:IS5 family transposase